MRKLLLAAMMLMSISAWSAPSQGNFRAVDGLNQSQLRTFKPYQVSTEGNSGTNTKFYAVFEGKDSWGKSKSYYVHMATNSYADASALSRDVNAGATILCLDLKPYSDTAGVFLCMTYIVNY